MLIIKKAQFNYVDVWDDSVLGWDSHTRVQIKKTDRGGKKAFYVAGIPLPKIKLVEIAKSI